MYSDLCLTGHWSVSGAAILIAMFKYDYTLGGVLYANPQG